MTALRRFRVCQLQLTYFVAHDFFAQAVFTEPSQGSHDSIAKVHFPYKSISPDQSCKQALYVRAEN
jgi:hypothetical protein